MRTETARKEYHQQGLKAIVGGKIKTSEVEHLVNTAWNFAYTSLWNSTSFSHKEIEAAKHHIEEYILLSKNKRKAFSNFCQRVLLARQYVNASQSRYLPLPSLWFDRNNLLGFAGTRSWFLQIKQTRESIPDYKAEINALAEAVLEFSEEPTKKNYQYWRRYFMERNCPGLLNLFQTTAIQQLYN